MTLKELQIKLDAKKLGKATVSKRLGQLSGFGRLPGMSSEEWDKRCRDRYEVWIDYATGRGLRGVGVTVEIAINSAFDEFTRGDL